MDLISGGLSALGIGAGIYGAIQSNKWASKNYDLNKRSLAESEFMNRNQFQVQSADAQKAGINPLAMSGGSVSSASASSVDSPNADALAGVVAQALQLKHEDKLQEHELDTTVSENEKQRKHEETMALMKMQHDEKLHSEKLSQEDKHFNSQLEELSNYHSEMIRIDDSKLSQKEKEIALSQKRYEMENSAQDIINSLRKQQKSLNDLDLRVKARDFASQLLTGFSRDKSGFMGFIERRLSQISADSIRQTISRKGKITPDEFADILVRELKNENE